MAPFIAHGNTQLILKKVKEQRWDLIFVVREEYMHWADLYEHIHLWGDGYRTPYLEQFDT
jgi:hypothetical protein